MRPTNITITTEDSGISLNYLNLEESHLAMKDLVKFLAEHPNLIDVFSLAANLAEHQLLSKLHNRNLIEY